MVSWYQFGSTWDIDLMLSFGTGVPGLQGSKWDIDPVLFCSRVGSKRDIDLVLSFGAGSGGMNEVLTLFSPWPTFASAQAVLFLSSICAFLRALRGD